MFEFACSIAHASVSEQKLQSELQYARIACRADASELRCGARRACDRTCAKSFGKVEVRMIEKIEKLRPELQPVAITQRNVFEQREVHDTCPWSFQNVAARGAESTGWLHGESGGVEPTFGCALVAGQVRVADQIGSLVEQAVVGAIAGDIDRERKPRLLSDNAARLPIAEQTTEQPALEFEWQVVGETGNEPVSRIETRASAFEALHVALVEIR